MDTTVSIREIRHTNCNTDGKESKSDEEGGHMFVILTKRSYNEKSNHVAGIPLTSKENFYSLNYGINLTNDDIDGAPRFLSKPTFILCDRICRINKENIHVEQEEYRITSQKWQEILKMTQLFLNTGKIKT